MAAESMNAGKKKAVALISSGIDSPVAAWVMKEKGLEIIGLHMDNRPFTDARQISKTKRLCKIIGIKKLYVSKHGLAMSDILKGINRRFTCILCRRLMFRTAERVAEKEGAQFMITGENLGQVASQTLDNMSVADKAVSSRMTILRPLLCYDKQDIVNIAKKIGTYEISIEPPGCCRLVPSNPATKSTVEQIEKEEDNCRIRDLNEDFDIEDVG